MEDSIFVVDEVEAGSMHTIANLDIPFFGDVLVAEGLKLGTCGFANP